ncbi:MAG TPA: formylmethanofuran dehydrogenase [Methyloceanibacter sp.]|jgi:formylmethanofuran dehydrogenase subunit B|nr:formylmethanofuran dehydrogenase [Methyloceanibacter sp.]
MPSSNARKTKGERAAPEQFENVACPFCGMICDDLTVERTDKGLKVLKNGCGKSIAGFERRLPPSRPQVGGKDVELAKAIKEAAKLIGKAELPLYGGLATDVEGMRGVMALAERSGGIVDHALSEAQYRNFKILQTTGWTTSTLTETRNRADLIIIAGSDVHKLHPRFFEKIVSPPDSMFDVTAPKRRVVFIGKGLDKSAAKGSRIGEVITLPCKPEQAGEVVGALRARLSDFRLKPLAIDGVALADIDALAELCRKAKYGVVVWAPPSLDFPHAELAVEQFTGLVKDLNQTTRFAGLALGGAEGATTAGAVSTWQSGYPLRVSYASGAPDYDPYRYAIGRMLREGEGDLLVWIASISPDLSPPATQVPTIVLGTPGLVLAKAPAVFIPVGTPGVDHAGRLVRVDNVVSLPLKDLGRAALPPAADVLAAIEAAL